MTEQPVPDDGPPIPLMVEGQIDASTLGQLFADLQTHAAGLRVQEKSAPTGFADPAALTPDAALERLLAGAARAVQLRYRFDGFEWIDTILALPAGFRVVRMRGD